MKPPFPSATITWHNDTYPAISPSRPELNVAGKNVIIVGAGSGIGRETASAFVKASASKVVLLGRNEASLIDTKNILPLENVDCSVYAVSATDEKALTDIAATVGVWDILVLAAGFVSNPSSIIESPMEEWWQSFETNVKGTMIPAKVFLPTANPSGAVVIGVTSGTSGLPPAMLPGLSAYIASKLAQVKLLEFLAAENPNIFVASVHPGMVETFLFRKSGARAEALPMDKVQLPAHFMVWLASPEAAFLKGKLVWANWDVDELKSRAQEIMSGQQMTSGVIGWPYPHTG